MQNLRRFISWLVILPLTLLLAIAPPLPTQADDKKVERGPTTHLKISPQHIKSKEARPKVEKHLKKLYEDFQSFRHKRSLGETGKFTPQNPRIQISNSHVAIDAIALGDPEDLKEELEGLGLKNAAVFGKMVSGLMPIPMVEKMPQCVYLNFARSSMAVLHTGSVTSQGDQALQADIARSTFSVDGSGVTVGVLSSSFDCLGGAAADVVSGDLPSVNVLDDTACSNTDEGRAMLQIVHDVSPGAALSFHTAFTGQANFAQGIVDLANAGANVIVDDVLYLAEPMFQDGIIAQAVDQVEATGVSYFSAAGNQARKSYEDAFREGDIVTIAGQDYQAHDFDPGSGVDSFQQVTLLPGQSLLIALQWDSPAAAAGGAGSPNDVDIYLTNDAETTILASSTDSNIGLDPVEILSFVNNSAEPDFNLVVVNAGGDNPGKIKYVRFGVSIINEFDTRSATSYGHANALGAEGTGAAFYLNTPAFGVDPPFLEPFSSIGGTPVLFDVAGNRLATPETRIKPNVVGPDGVDTTFFSASGFFGTSAAAPHVAGVAALMLEVNPGLLPAEIYSVLESTAIDMDDSGTAGFDTGADFATGYGLIQADAALASVPAPVNTEPTVAAGPDQTILFPADATLNGTVTDDNLVQPVPTVIWSLENGPGTATFTDDTSPDTTVSFSEVGTYVLRLTAFDGEFTAFDEVTIRTANAVATTLDIRVNAGSDDAEERESGRVSIGSSDLEFTFDGGDDQKVGMRFNAVTIPQGATITQASIQFQVDEINTGPTSLAIQGEKTANAATFTTANGNISSRPLTTASVAWPPVPWNSVGEAGPDQQTQDLTPVIQEIVNLPDWASGNSLAVIISGTGERTAESFNGGASAAPLLQVEYLTAPDVEPPSVPTALTATAVFSTRINLTWNASTDNTAVSGYEIFRCQGSGCVPNEILDSTTATSYSNGNLPEDTAFTYSVVAFDASGNRSNASASATAATPEPSQAISFTLVGAGDIGGNSSVSNPEATALLIDNVVAEDPSAIVFTAGDNAYSDGTATDFQDYYDPSWGRHRFRTLPAPGNHDYHVAGAADYLDYFCPSANDCVFPGGTQQLFYSYDLGNWHIVVLDSFVDYEAGSAQVQWLKQDLAQHAGSCILAYFHYPYYSSGNHGDSSRAEAFWQELYNAGADVVVSGHDHDYERFAKQDLNRNLDPKGIRNFVAGTGGVNLRVFRTPKPNSEVRYDGSYGVIKFTLRDGGYDWEFISEAGFTFTDTGSDICNHVVPVADVPVPDLAGQTQVDAEALILGAGLVVGAVTPQNDPVVPAGSVIDQNPLAGNLVVLGSAVDMIVSLGPVVSQETLAIRVNAASDDAEERTSGSVSTGSSDLEFTFDGGDDQKVGMRFNAVTIPQGATITQASIQFQVDQIDTGPTSLAIQGEKIANALTFISASLNISSRPLTTASVNWSPVPWDTVGEAGPDQETPDLTSVIQEIVNLPDWASGNSLAVIISGTGERTAESFNGVASAAALLHIVYSTSPPPPPVPVPDVVGQSQVDAEALILGAGLVVGTVATQNDPVIPAGEVIDQNPLATTLVAPGSAVDLVVSLGPPPPPVAVPDVVGQSQVDAEALILGAGLAVGTVTNQSDPVIPVGEVISQNPSATTLVAPGSAVDFLISSGAAGSEETLDIRVSAASDDAEERISSSVSTGSTDLELTYDRSGDQIVGMRFNGVTIPQCSSITHASIQFQVDEISTGPTSLAIQGEKIANALTFISASLNISSRPLTTASVNWSPVPWDTVGEAGPDQETPEIASILQEIIDLTDWASGNSLAVIITGTGKRTAESFNGLASAAALLHIEYVEIPCP